MGIMVYSLLWVVQDLYHQPYVGTETLVGGLQVQPVEKPQEPPPNLPIWDFPKIRGSLFWGPCNKDPTT